MKPGEPTSFTDYREKLLEEQREAMRLSLPWAVPDELPARVGRDGKLLPLGGDTIVFRLQDEELDELEKLRVELTRGLEHLFCEPLHRHELHLTLHDLSTPSSEQNLERSRAILRRLEPGCVRMKPANVYPCLNISVLLGYVPASGEDYEQLMSWHRAFDEVVELGWWLRPHVTLAYFRPRAYTAEEVTRLKRRLAELEPGPELRLELGRLFYQRFTDMNHYQDVAGVFQ